jgi:hypothetical protein
MAKRMLSLNLSSVTGFAIAALAFCMLSGVALAQDTRCSRNDLMAATIQVAKTGNDKDPARVAAIKTLVDNWRFTIPELVRAIAVMKHTAASTWDAAEIEWAITLTSIVKNTLANFDQSIQLFRTCDDETVIKPLVWAARGDNREIRLNAANILANVVDNTTVCFVLHHLNKEPPGLTDDGRANLLGITRAMASYAYKENVEAIEKVTKKMGVQLQPRLKDLPQTAALLTNIAARLANSQNGKTLLPESLQSTARTTTTKPPSTSEPFASGVSAASAPFRRPHRAS